MELVPWKGLQGAAIAQASQLRGNSARSGSRAVRETRFCPRIWRLRHAGRLTGRPTPPNLPPVRNSSLVVAFFSLIGASIAVACGGGAPEPETPETKPAATAAPVKTAPDPEPASVGGGEETTTDGPCPEGMALMEGGKFWMGSREGEGEKDEHPRHNLEIADFCLDVSEVSVSDYQGCIDNDICDPAPTEVQLMPALNDAKKSEALSKLCSVNVKDNAQLPINCVSQDDALKYCKWKGRRLPSERELEFAAAGGLDALPYPWGSDEPDANKLCWNTSKPCAVKSRPHDALGVYGLAGNVSEWTSTFYGEYPKPPMAADEVAVRGGNFQSKKPEEVRAQRRRKAAPIERTPTIGFRCALSR